MSRAYGPIVKAYEENSHWKYGLCYFLFRGKGGVYCCLQVKFDSRLINLLCLQALGDKEIGHFTVVRVLSALAFFFLTGK